MKRGVLSQHAPLLAYEKNVNLLFAIVSEL